MGNGDHPSATRPMGVIERIIDASARNRFVVLIAVVLGVTWGVYAIKRTPLDALPDLSDTQVIIFTEWMGRSPTLVEDQVTYPLTTTFLAAPRVKLVRGFTMFGMSFVYVVFEDGTDIYWARSRVLEYLSKLQGKLPPGVTPQVGPDATGGGWVLEYALVSRCEAKGSKAVDCPDLQQLRSFQDWDLRYALASVPGVAEVASLGGFERQYQIELDPVKLQAYGLSITEIAAAVRASNGDVGGSVLELAGHEYAIRGRGYITKKEDLAEIVVAVDGRGTPVRLSDVARIQVGANARRGLAELDGQGEVVGGIVVMRFGENALDVIQRVKARIEELRPSLPAGTELVLTYDRAPLIDASIRTLTSNLLQVMVTVVLMIVLFLFHVRSTLVAAITLPVAVILSFIPMYYMGLTINIMSLAGIIIAVGDMVDSAVVLVENAHKKLEHAGGTRPRVELVIAAARELGPAIFGSLLVITISFLPVFVLEAQEGRLFKPLAFTKSFSMAFASILAITLVPVLMVFFVRGKIRPELANPINRACIAAYRPTIRFILRHRYASLAAMLLILGATAFPWRRLGSEFMPPLDEGSILFMPITVPGISIEEAKGLLQKQDAALKKFPEVRTVFGKAGRAETATDPAPLSMIETVIVLHPRSQWRPGMTKEKLLAEMNAAVDFPGLQNAWTMPIKARVDMLTTGIRTPIGVKVFGRDLKEIARVGEELERILMQVPGTRSVYAERELGGFFIDFVPDRAALARHGLRVADVMQIVETAIGGLVVDTTIEGRERYTINVRYPRELRDDLEKLRAVLVPLPGTGMSGSAMAATESTMAGGSAMRGSRGGMGAAATPPAATAGDEGRRRAQIPLGQLGKIEATLGPPMIKSEAGSLTGWVYVDVTDRDIGGYVDDAKAAVARELRLQTGYYLKWTGQYEFLERIRARMAIVIPLTLLIVFAILYFNFRGITQALLVMMAVPFAAVGSVWLMWLARFNTSIAVWVGMIALLGVAAETASMMVVYLDEGFHTAHREGRLRSIDDLVATTIASATLRVRPLLMTVGMNIVGLIPVMIDTGIGSDVAKRIAAPLWGGLISLTILTLAGIPVLHLIWRSVQIRHELRAESGRSP
ncbi:MAG TPA: CusA/CzcA family heavy metal efflux RND transporter [Polyangia bacterium]